MKSKSIRTIIDSNTSTTFKAYCAFTTVPWCMRVMLLTQELAFWRKTRMCCALFASRRIHTRVVVLMNAHRRLTRKRRYCWMKSLVLFSLHTKYSCSFVTLPLNRWCHMDFFTDILTTFLGLERGSCVAVYAGSESSRIWSKISSLVFQR